MCKNQTKCTRTKQEVWKGIVEKVQKMNREMYMEECARIKSETLKSMSEEAQPKEFSQNMFEDAYNMPQGMNGLDGPNGTVMPTYDELGSFQY